MTRAVFLVVLLPALAHSALAVVSDGPAGADPAARIAAGLTKAGVEAAPELSPATAECLSGPPAALGPCLTTATRRTVVVVGAAQVGKRVVVTVDVYAAADGRRVIEDAWKGPSAGLAPGLERFARALAGRLSPLPPETHVAPSAPTAETRDAPGGATPPSAAATPTEEPRQTPSGGAASTAPEAASNSAVAGATSSSAPDRASGTTSAPSSPATGAPAVGAQARLTPPARAPGIDLKSSPSSNAAAWTTLGIGGAAAAAALGFGLAAGLDSGRLASAPGGVSALRYTEAQAVASRANLMLGIAIGAGVAAGMAAVLTWLLWESP